MTADGKAGAAPSWGELLEKGKQILRDADVAEAELDAWYLFSEAFGISRAQYLLCAREKANGIWEKPLGEKPPGAQDEGGCDSRLTRYEAFLSRRANREPLQHILGVQEFMGLEFCVNRHTLIPRQDTETLVETVLSEEKDRSARVLDMCTGSGCIAVSLAVYGGYRLVEGADISSEALKMAEKNGARLLWDRERADRTLKNGTAETALRFRESDLFSAFSPEEKFEIIVSNPPYIASAEILTLEPEVREFEPMGALDGMEDGLYFYRRLAAESGAHLTAKGRVYFEIGYDQGEAVSALLTSHGFDNVRVIKDLTGKDRVVCGELRAETNEEGSYV